MASMRRGISVRARIMVVVVVVASALAVVPANADPGAWFEASLSYSSVAGCEWLPNTMINVHVGAPIPFDGSQPSDPNGCVNMEIPFMMAPGNTVLVDDGVSFKDLLIEQLRIDGIDPNENTIWGTAPPNRTFNVDADTTGNNTWVSLPPVTSDGGGNWFGDFDDVGVDLLSNTHVGANIPDIDGDHTAFDFQMGCCGPPGRPMPEYTDPNAFRNAIAQLGEPTVIDFEDIDAAPGNDIAGREEFDGTHYQDQGATFSNPNGEKMYIAPGGLIACGGDPNDPNNCGVWNESNSLSIGEFPFPAVVVDQNDDDLRVTFDPPLAALGFTLVDSGGQGPEESIRWYDAYGELIDETNLGSGFDPWRAFAGMVSPSRPIGRIEITEAANDGDDVNYDDFILVPPPAPDFTPADVAIADQPLRTDYGSTPAFVGWSRRVDVTVANLGSVDGAGALDVWVRSETDGTETFIGSSAFTIQAHRTRAESFNWNGSGILGDVTVFVRVCAEDDANTGNDEVRTPHHVLAGGTGFGVTGPQTFPGIGEYRCAG